MASGNSQAPVSQDVVTLAKLQQQQQQKLGYQAQDFQLSAQQDSFTDSSFQVQVGGRLLAMNKECQSSIGFLKRDLAQRLQISGPAAIQIFDQSHLSLNSDEDLQLALREGRHPLQATLTAVALRDIEQRKFEVESKKEELSHFQWQIVVDQVKALSDQVTKVASQVVAMQEECRREMHQVVSQSDAKLASIDQLLSKDSAERHGSLHDIEAKLATVVQTIATERNSRDVAVHQLRKQVETVEVRIESERTARGQNWAETCHAIEAIRNEVEKDQARTSTHWNQQLEAIKRLEQQVEDRASSDNNLQQTVSHLTADGEKLRANVAQLEANVALNNMSSKESMQRRSEEMRKAVRDEMTGRENHFARLAKDLETAFQNLESRMTRARDESADGVGTLAERTRILEQRCGSLEQEIMMHADTQREKDRNLEQQIEQAVGAVDSVEVGVKASDIVMKTTASKVESLSERVVAIENDLQYRPSMDFFKPQLESIQRVSSRQESKMLQIERDMNTRFANEAQNRDAIKAQVRSSVRDCLDKLGADAVAAVVGGGKSAETVRIDITNPSASANRFTEIPGSAEDIASPSTAAEPLASQPVHALSGTVKRPSPSQPTMTPGSRLSTVVLTAAGGAASPSAPPPASMTFRPGVPPSLSGVRSPSTPMVPPVQLVQRQHSTPAGSAAISYGSPRVMMFSPRNA